MTLKQLQTKATNLFREYFENEASEEEMVFWAESRFLVERAYQSGWSEAQKEFETDAERAQEQYDDGYQAGEESALVTVEEIDDIDFYKVKQDSVGDERVEMNDEFKDGAIWGWNTAREALIESISEGKNDR